MYQHCFLTWGSSKLLCYMQLLLIDGDEGSWCWFYMHQHCFSLSYCVKIIMLSSYYYVFYLSFHHDSCIMCMYPPRRGDQRMSTTIWKEFNVINNWRDGVTSLALYDHVLIQPDKSVEIDAWPSIRIRGLVLDLILSETPHMARNLPRGYFYYTSDSALRDVIVAHVSVTITFILCT